MDPRIQVKLDKHQKCRNIISQTSLLSSYTGSVSDIVDSLYPSVYIYSSSVNVWCSARRCCRGRGFESR